MMILNSVKYFYNLFKFLHVFFVIYLWVVKLLEAIDENGKFLEIIKIDLFNFQPCLNLDI